MIRRAVVAAAVALVAFAASACGVQPSAAIGGNAAPSGAPVPSISRSTDSIYLIANGTLVLIRRAGEDLTGAAAIAALAHGPSPAEKQKGLVTEVPPSVVPAVIFPSSDGTVVQLSSAATELSVLATRQIVCTLSAQDAPGARFIITGGGQTLPPQICR